MSNSTHPERVVVEKDFLRHGGNHHNVTNRDAVLEQLKTLLFHQLRGSKSYMVSGRDFNWFRLDDVLDLHNTICPSIFFMIGIWGPVCPWPSIQYHVSWWNKLWPIIAWARSVNINPIFREWTNIFIFISPHNSYRRVSPGSKRNYLGWFQMIEII